MNNQNRVMTWQYMGWAGKKDTFVRMILSYTIILTEYINFNYPTMLVYVYEYQESIHFSLLHNV